MSADSLVTALGSRIRAERLELRLNQIEFGKLAGISETSQTAYEKGKTAPPVSYLLRLAEHGVDIGYVLTGQRRDGSLSREHELLFELFGKLSARERQAVFELMSILAGATVPLAAIDLQARAGREQLGRLHEPKIGYRGQEQE